MKKKSTVIVIVAILVVSVYWLKNLIGINTFESYSISKYFPFKYLQRDLTINPEQGEIIIDESFDKNGLFKKTWGYFWMREKGKVTLNYDKNGFHNSRCLLIKSNSDKSWTYSSLKFVEVKKGDVFSYEGFSCFQGEDAYATFSLASYDKDKNVIKWDYEKTIVSQNNKINKITKRFTVTDGIAFIKFRITGVGVGEFRFDDIKFRKL